MANHSYAAASTAAQQLVTPTPSYGYLVLLCVPLVTVFGNGLMILAVLLDKKLKSSVTNRYTAALAFADLLIGLIPMPFAVYVKVNRDHWDLGDGLCRLYTAFDVAGSTASILHLVLISGDRYLAVMWPHEYQRYAKRASVTFPIVLMWLISASLSIPVVMGKSILNVDACWLENPEYMLYSSLLSFYIPASVLTLMYVKIFRKLNRHKGIRTMLRASGGSDTGAPFHLPLVVVQEVSYAQPPPTSAAAAASAASAASSALCQNGGGLSSSSYAQQADKTTNQRAPEPAPQPPAVLAAESTGNNAISAPPRACLCSSSSENKPAIISRSKTCPSLDDDTQLSDHELGGGPNKEKARKLTTVSAAINDEELALLSPKDGECIPHIDATPSSHHAFFPLWSHLRHNSQDGGRHRLVEEKDDEEMDEEEQNRLLPEVTAVEEDARLQRSASTRSRRPCVVATRRFSLWLAGGGHHGNDDHQDLIHSPTAGTLAAIDTARSKLLCPSARHYLESLHPSASRSHLIVNHFDPNAWTNDSLEDDDEDDHDREPTPVRDSVGEVTTTTMTTEVFTLPHPSMARAGSTFRKLANRLTTVLQRKTDKQAIVKEKKATKLVAMILGTCGVFIISWLPFFTFNIMRGICLSITDSVSDCEWLPSELFFLTTWLGYANSGFNPILYGLFNEHFRTTYKRLLRWPSKSRPGRWSF